MNVLVVVISIAVLVTGCGPGGSLRDACVAALEPGDLVITEVFANFHAAPGASADTGREWFEIYNPRDRPIDVDGLIIDHARMDGSSAHSLVLGPAVVAAGQYYTLGNAEPARVPAYLDQAYGDALGDLFNTGGGRLVIACGDRELDRASYDHVVEGHARALSAGLVPEAIANDAPDSWCQAGGSEFDAGNFGTPGAANDCRPVAVGQCSDRGVLRNAVPPDAGDLVVTEVMPSPARVSDAAGEWFEAQVMRDVDLVGVALDRSGDGRRPDVIPGPDCVRVTAGSHVVFARAPAAGQTDGGLPPEAVIGRFSFSLVEGTAGAPGDVAIIAGGTVIDAVRWTRSRLGAALQLDPARTDATSNDDEANFCDATAPYGPAGADPDRGTPGAANAACARLPPAGMCDDGGLRAIRPPAHGALVIGEVLANPAPAPDGSAADAAREWFEVNNTGTAAFDLNELRVGRVGVTGTAIQSARCLSVAPGAAAVFARSNDPAINGMLPRVDVTFAFGLTDRPGDLQIARDGQVLDAVRWSSTTSGVSRQLDPAHLAPADPDGTSRWVCPATSLYGDQTNRGTPGSRNAPCP